MTRSDDLAELDLFASGPDVRSGSDLLASHFSEPRPITAPSSDNDLQALSGDQRGTRIECKPLPPISLIRTLLDYDPATGRMHWAVDRGRMRRGDEAGYVLADGCWVVKINGKKYKRARLAWAHYHGVEPTYSACHVDRWSKNDRLANLRDIPFEEHMARKGKAGPDPDPNVFPGMLRAGAQAAGKTGRRSIGSVQVQSSACDEHQCKADESERTRS
jgi:hypothetical protein